MNSARSSLFCACAFNFLRCGSATTRLFIPPRHLTVTAGCLYLQAEQVRELGKCVILQASQLVPWQVPETQRGVTSAGGLCGTMLHRTDWRHGNALGSYSGGTRFEFRPGHWISWVLSWFPRPFQAISGAVPQIGSYRIIPKLSNSWFIDRIIRCHKVETSTASWRTHKETDHYSDLNSGPSQISSSLSGLKVRSIIR